MFSKIRLVNSEALVLYCLAFLSVVAGFSTNLALSSNLVKRVPTSRATIMHKYARRKPVLNMADEDSSKNSPVMDDEANKVSSAGSVLSESFVESVVMPDNTVIQGVDTTLSPVSLLQEADVAKDIVEAAMSDPSTADFIGEGGVVTDLPPTTATTDEPPVIVDGVMPSPDTVIAFLAASEEAAVAAEAKLSPEEAEMVPLIPTLGQNNTSGVATEVQEIPSILPASEVVGEPVTAVPSEIDTPDVKKILQFAVPAIGVWLCGPLLSLIDTSAVGLFSGTFQQAALNPAVAVTDYAALLIVSVCC